MEVGPFRQDELSASCRVLLNMRTAQRRQTIKMLDYFGRTTVVLVTLVMPGIVSGTRADSGLVAVAVEAVKVASYDPPGAVERRDPVAGPSQRHTLSIELGSFHTAATKRLFRVAPTVVGSRLHVTSSPKTSSIGFKRGSWAPMC
jgi:hypothetical protein